MPGYPAMFEDAASRDYRRQLSDGRPARSAEPSPTRCLRRQPAERQVRTIMVGVRLGVVGKPCATGQRQTWR